MAKISAILMAFSLFASVWGSDPGFARIEAPGLHNVFSIGPNLFSGNSPEDDEGFASLRTLGVKTLISVDGAKPDVKGAERFGLRYIHLPHSYDTISARTQLQLVKAAKTAEGPIYVHCHHGKHRGPAAAAIICRSEKGWTSAQAEDWLHAAGTGTNYIGLFRSVREFRLPSTEELNAIPSTFLPAQPVSKMVESMAEIDQRFEHLKLIQKAGFKVPADHPDLVPASEATLLREHFRELQRTAESKAKGEEFLLSLKESEVQAEAIEQMFKKGIFGPPEMEKSFARIGKQCAICHKKFRD